MSDKARRFWKHFGLYILLWPPLSVGLAYLLNAVATVMMARLGGPLRFDFPTARILLVMVYPSTLLAATLIGLVMSVVQTRGGRSLWGAAAAVSVAPLLPIALALFVAFRNLSLAALGRSFAVTLLPAALSIWTMFFLPTIVCAFVVRRLQREAT